MRGSEISRADGSTCAAHRAGKASINMELHATTILTVRHQGRVAMAGDGQVTLGHGGHEERRGEDPTTGGGHVSCADLRAGAPMRLRCWSGLKPS